MKSDAEKGPEKSEAQATERERRRAQEAEAPAPPPEEKPVSDETVGRLFPGKNLL